MKTQAESDFRNRCAFEVSCRYDLFYSLNVLLDPNSRIHSRWRSSTTRLLGHEFQRLMTQIGGSWEIWPVLASLLPGDLANPTFSEVTASIRELSIEDFQGKILLGLLHKSDIVESLLQKRLSLKSAITKLPKTKREWINHIGLYPYDPKSPQILAVENLLLDPEMFRKLVLQILEIYWKQSFQTTWNRLLPQLQRSREMHERLFHSCSWEEFSKQSLLRIDVDSSKSEMVAIRGGFRLPYSKIKRCYFIPSAFNDRRFWSAFEDNDGGTIVFFPYFDPSIALDLQPAASGPSLEEPPLDPALIFKALGDTTRFAIATILARTPKSSVELARILSVSKPTISHHIHLLRQAGLIQETFIGGALQLQLKRTTIEILSQMTISKLFESNDPMDLTRTRSTKS